MDKLGFEGSKQTERWFNENLLDFFYVLIHKRDHWSLISLNIEDKHIEYFDSISGSRNISNALRVIKRFMKEYCNKRDQAMTSKIRIR